MTPDTNTATQAPGSGAQHPDNLESELHSISMRLGNIINAADSHGLTVLSAHLAQAEAWVDREIANITKKAEDQVDNSLGSLEETPIAQAGDGTPPPSTPTNIAVTDGDVDPNASSDSSAATPTEGTTSSTDASTTGEASAAPAPEASPADATATPAVPEPSNTEATS